MSRQIRFRGKRIDNGEWVYGDLVHGVCDVYSKIIECGIQTYGNYPYEVDPNTVGQFTGLQDKNGVDVYEGDIVKCNSFESVVSFSVNTGYRIVDREDRIMGYKGYTNLGNKRKKIEVIGNIHDKE